MSTSGGGSNEIFCSVNQSLKSRNDLVENSSQLSDDLKGQLLSHITQLSSNVKSAHSSSDSERATLIKEAKNAYYLRASADAKLKFQEAKFEAEYTKLNLFRHLAPRYIVPLETLSRSFC